MLVNFLIKRESVLAAKYFTCILVGFLVTLSPIFSFDGKLQDADYIFFVSMDFTQFLNIIKNEIGSWRVIAFSFEYLIPKIFYNAPFKSYIALFIFYFTYFVLCEKILSLLRIKENLRILIFSSLTTTVFVLPTVLTWTRTQNEFLAVLISWFFIKKITKSKNDNLKIVLVIIWGIVSLLSYELFFPFLVILLFAFGFIPRKTILIGALILPIIFFVIPVYDQKVNYEASHLFFGLDSLLSYFEHKSLQLITCIKQATLPNVAITGSLVFLMILLHLLNSKNLIKSDFTIKRHFVIVLFSVIILLIFYFLSWPYSSETISSYGKLNWNIISIFWFNILVALTYRFKNKFLNLVMLIPIFLTTFLSGVLVRVLENEMLIGNTQFLYNSLFKNILVYVGYS